MKRHYIKLHKETVDNLIIGSLKNSVRKNMLGTEINHDIDGSIVVTWIENDTKKEKGK